MPPWSASSWIQSLCFYIWKDEFILEFLFFPILIAYSSFSCQFFHGALFLDNFKDPVVCLAHCFCCFLCRYYVDRSYTSIRWGGPNQTLAQMKLVTGRKWRGWSEKKTNVPAAITVSQQMFVWCLNFFGSPPPDHPPNPNLSLEPPWNCVHCPRVWVTSENSDDTLEWLPHVPWFGWVACS